MKKLWILLLLCNSVWGYELFYNRLHWEQNIIYYSDPKFRDYCHEATLEWSIVLGNKISIIETEDPLLANVLIISNPAPGSFILAYTNDNYDNSVITNAKITVLREDIVGTACLLHEWGHVLGLNHSEIENSVMYKFLNVNLLQPTEDDINGICDLYGISYSPDIHVKVTWIKGRWFQIESYTGAIVTYKKYQFVIDHLPQKIYGRYPLELTIHFRNLTKTFKILKPNKHTSTNLVYEY